jgi:hypothetical protein
MDLLGSVEFGDWLIHEMARHPVREPADDVQVSKRALTRAQSLETTRVILLEYLTLQDEMMSAARQRSRSRVRQTGN